MAEFPALPLFTDAYLSDTRHLSTEEHGAYILLMMEAWRRPDCSLPDDDALLARLAGLSETRWAEVRAVVLSFWERDGRRKVLTQKRLSKEREYVSQKRALNREKSAKRWNKTINNDATAMPMDMPNGMPGVSQPTPTPTHKEEPKGSKKTEGFAELIAVLDDAHASAVIEHRRKIKKPLTSHAAKLLAGKFAKTRDPNAAADAMIAGGWQGFEPEWMDRQKATAQKPGVSSVLQRYDWIILSDGRVKSKAIGDDEWLLHDGVTAEQVESIAIRDHRAGNKQEASH